MVKELVQVSSITAGIRGYPSQLRNIPSYVGSCRSPIPTFSSVSKGYTHEDRSKFMKTSSSRRTNFVAFARVGDPREIDKSEKLQDPYGKVDAAMSTEVVTVSPDSSVDSIMHHFEHFTGLPVVDTNGRCVGIVSDVDVTRYAHGRSISSLPATSVKDVMTSPAVVILQHAPVAYAAGLMLHYNIHRLPVVDPEGTVVGIVTRNDVFEPLVQHANSALYMVLGHREPSSLSDW